MRKDTALILTGVASVGALLAGGRFNPGPAHPQTAIWYESLDKPSLTPPGPVFGVAWTVLDGLLWYTGYRLLRHPSSGQKRWAVGTWLATLLGLPGYSFAFFGRHRPDQALGVTAGMLGTSIGLAATSAKLDRPAAAATIPLVLWTSFALFLQSQVWRHNR